MPEVNAERNTVFSSGTKDPVAKSVEMTVLDCTEMSLEHSQEIVNYLLSALYSLESGLGLMPLPDEVETTGVCPTASGSLIRIRTKAEDVKGTLLRLEAIVQNIEQQLRSNR